MSSISVLERKKEYIVLKVPRKLLAGMSFVFEPKRELTETQALKILRAGMSEYRAGKTRTLSSLRDIRQDEN